MKRQSNDNSNADTIMGNNGFRSLVGIILTFIISVTGYFYTQYYNYTIRADGKVEALREYIDTKTASRTSKAETAQLEKSIEQRFIEKDKRNDQQHINFQRQIDRIASNNRNN